MNVNSYIIAIVVLIMVILVLFGVIAVLSILLHQTKVEYATNYAPVDLPDITWHWNDWAEESDDGRTEV